MTPDIILPSINNHAELGEASLPGALPWDTIASAKFEPVNYVAPHLDELRKRSATRVTNNKDYDYMRREIEHYLKIKEDKSVSLNEEKRRKEMKDNEARAEARKRNSGRAPSRITRPTTSPSNWPTCPACHRPRSRPTPSPSKLPGDETENQRRRRRQGRRGQG